MTNLKLCGCSEKVHFSGCNSYERRMWPWHGMNSNPSIGTPSHSQITLRASMNASHQCFMSHWLVSWEVILSRFTTAIASSFEPNLTEKEIRDANTSVSTFNSSILKSQAERSHWWVWVPSSTAANVTTLVLTWILAQTLGSTIERQFWELQWCSFQTILALT